MGLVGGLLAVGRPLAHILHRQGAGDDQHLLQAALFGAFEHHAAEARVHRQTRQLAAQRGQLAVAADRRELLQQGVAVADGLAVRRLDEGEGVDLAQAQVEHLQDHRGQVGTQDLRVGEFGATEEVLLAVQADADARLDPPATALALVGAGLGHRLDGQALDLGAVAVAADARGAGIDHVADARHGQRGLGDVGGQDDLAPRHGLEDLLLLGRGQPRIQRQHLGVPEVGLAQHLGAVADLPLAGQEHQHVARALALAAFEGGQFVEAGENRLVHREVLLDPVALLVLLGGQRPVPGLHRVGAPRHLHHRRARKAGPTEVLGEAFQVDGRRGDDQLEVGPARQQGLQVAEQKIDVQAALVGLVDNDRVVLVEEAVVLGLGQQDAVGHQLDQAALVALVLEAHLVAHQLTQRRADLFRHPGGHAARGQAARLGVTDQTMGATAQLQADLRQLGGLARAGLAGDHHHLMGADRRLDLVALGGDRQGVVVAHGRHAEAARLDLGGGGLEALQPLRQLGLIRGRRLAQLMQLTAQAVAVGDQCLVEVFQQEVECGSLVGHRGRGAVRLKGRQRRPLQREN